MSPLLQAKSFLENNRLASIATVSGLTRDPQIAVVYYVYENGVLYFATEKSSRKAQDLIQNKKVALLVVQEKQLELLQLEGEGHAVADSDENLRIIGQIYENLRKKDAHDPWPAIKLHPKELQAFKVEVEKFKYSNFSEGTIVLEGTPSDWSQNFAHEEEHVSHESQPFSHPHLGPHIKKG